MLYCDDVLCLLETIISNAEHFYIGKLDNKKDKSIGVYSGDKLNSRICLGGIENNLYDVQRFTILVHWTKHPYETENIATMLHKKLSLVNNQNVNDKFIYYVNTLYNVPIDVYTDDNGVYERVIDIEIYSRKD